MKKRSTVKDLLLSVFEDDLSHNEDAVDEKRIQAYIDRERSINSHHRKCNAILEDGYVCTSVVEYDITADLKTLSLFGLLNLKAYLKTLQVEYNTAYGHSIKELLATVELQIQKILVAISVVKNETIKIFIPIINELQVSLILTALLKQQFLYSHQLKTNSL